MKYSSIAALSLIAWHLSVPALSAEEKPQPVKKSNARLCYEAGTPKYDQIKHFTTYDSMEACLESGGRPAARKPSPEEETAGLSATKQARPEPLL